MSVHLSVCWEPIRTRMLLGIISQNYFLYNWSVWYWVRPMYCFTSQNYFLYNWSVWYGVRPVLCFIFYKRTLKYIKIKCTWTQLIWKRIIHKYLLFKLKNYEYWIRKPCCIEAIKKGLNDLVLTELCNSSDP